MAIKLELPEHVVQQLLEDWKEEEAALEAHLGELHQLIKSAEAQLAGRFPSQGSFKQETGVKMPDKGTIDMGSVMEKSLPKAAAQVVTPASVMNRTNFGRVTVVHDRDGRIISSTTVSNKTPSGRRPKGENLRIVKEYLKLTGEGGATATQIARATNIGLSSVRLVLERNEGAFTRGDDSLWKLKN